MEKRFLIYQLLNYLKYLLVIVIIFYPVLIFGKASQDSLEIKDINIDYEVEGDFIKETLLITFNLYKGEDRDLFIKEGQSIDIKAYEYDKNGIKTKFEYFPDSFKNLKKNNSGEGKIPEDITISLLIDRSGSLSDSAMIQIQNAVEALVNKVPDSCLYFSWFDSYIYPSILLTQDNFKELNFEREELLNTALYNAIYTKLLEFDEDSIPPNIDFENEYRWNKELSRRNSGNKYLIVLTDGVNDVEGEDNYLNKSGFRKISNTELKSALMRYKSKDVQLFALGFGEESNNFDSTELKSFCAKSGNPKGYFTSNPDGILKLLQETIPDQMTPDYEIKLKFPEDLEYWGYLRKLKLEINLPDNKIHKAVGMRPYKIGGSADPKFTKKKSVLDSILYGLIAGIVFLLVIMIVIQLIIPLIKNKIFNIKYIKKYKPAENEILKECQYCGDPLNAGELVVAKCQHIVHKACWGDFDYVCPEYGQNCNDGKQHHFDISDPFSKKNKIYYMKWVLYGMIGGFLTWICYMAIKNGTFLNDFTSNTILMVNSNLSGEDISSFSSKIRPLYIIGLFMGFFLTLYFSFIEEFRRKSLVVISRIVLRALVGSIIGFAAFYVGSIILILLKVSETSFIVDWIPWIIFGISLGFLLSVKTTISWKHGVLGGLLSIIFAFLVLFARDLEYNATLISFMLYGAGLGFSIATIRTAAELYFLKIIQGKKHEETIPVHKWMSFQGGHNEVYIGTGFSCEIQMNWENDNPDVAEKHLKMYINTSRNNPVIVSLEKDKFTTFDERIEMDPGKEYDLYNGNKFRIGNTVFQYHEKDSIS